MVEQRATWKEMEEKWIIPKLDLAGNNTTATTTATHCEPICSTIRGLPRPETEYARRQRTSSASDPTNPRWRHDNVIDLELDTDHYNTDELTADDLIETGSLRKDIQKILNMDIDDQGRPIHNLTTDLPNPYMRYSKKEDGKSNTRSKSKSKKSKSLKL